MFWKKKDKSKQPAAVELPPATGALELYVVIRTDLGNVRTNNEDAASYVRMADDAIRQTRGFLLIVADGMGGHNAGEVASKIAIDTISQEYFKGSNGNNFEKALGKAFNTANKKILELASAHEAYKGMGTTCTAVVVTATAIYFAHAGDSRAYLYKNKSLSRVTEDHTYVQQLVNNGDITAEEADGHPQRNILTNAMGTKPDLRVDTGSYSGGLQSGDRILICSDGLYDYIHDEELKEILNYESLENIADSLIREAKKRGGHDNITVALAERKEPSEKKVVKSTRDMDMPVQS